MPKRVANALTLLSAVVCVGSALLVGRSLFRSDFVYIPFMELRSGGAAVLDGQLMLFLEPGGKPFAYTSEAAAEARSETFEEIWARLRGVRWLGVGWGILYWVRIVVLPLWLLPLLTAIPPVRWWRARRRNATRGFAVERTAA